MERIDMDMQKDEVKPSGKRVNAGVWKRMMRNYTLAMIAGMASLACLMPNLHNDASTMMLGGVLIGGLLLFGGAFGIVVSIFFHYLNKNS